MAGLSFKKNILFEFKNHEKALFLHKFLDSIYV